MKKHIILIFLFCFLSIFSPLVADSGKRIYTLEISSDAADGSVIPGVPVHYSVQGFPDEIDNRDVSWRIHDRMGFLIEDIAHISEDGILSVNLSAKNGDTIIVEAYVLNQWLTKISDEEELTVTLPDRAAAAAQQYYPVPYAENENDEEDDDFWIYGEGDGSLVIRANDAGMPGEKISGRTILLENTNYVLFADAMHDNGLRKLNFDWNVSDRSIARVENNYGSNLATVIFEDEGTVKITARDRDDKNKTGYVTLHRYCPVINISLYEIDSAKPGETVDIYGHVITSWNTVKLLRGRNITWSAAVNGKTGENLSFIESELNDLYPGFIAAKLRLGEGVKAGDVVTVRASYAEDPSESAFISFRVTEAEYAERASQPFLERIICTDLSDDICESHVPYDEKYDSAAMNSSLCSNNSFRQVRAKICDRHDRCGYKDRMMFVCSS